MAQANAEEEERKDMKSIKEKEETTRWGSSSASNKGAQGGAGSGRFKFNADAAEFVPRSHPPSNPVTLNNNNSQMGISGYYYPYLQFLDEASSADWFYLHPNTSPHSPSPSNTNTANSNQKHQHSAFQSPISSPTTSSLNSTTITDVLSHEHLPPKIIKQVEYLFSDLSLMANDTMAKHVSKDPEGYVPIPVIASMKKIKALVSDQHLLVQALRSSSKLVVSKDNKRVKRRSPFTENYKDDLQCRTIIVENLPEEHSYPNLEKIFSVVGSVKAIRLCHPPEVNPSRSKNEVIISNKLHALVEYENAEIAERAAERLNDERNWRKGMRVRVMLRRTPKSVLKGRKSDFDIFTDDDDGPQSPEETPNLNAADFFADSSADENSPTSRKASVRGRGKTKGRIQCHTGRGLLASPTQSIGSPFNCDPSTKQTFKGPRMPDGTRGFTMGRGKPIVSCSTTSSPTF